MDDYNIAAQINIINYDQEPALFARRRTISQPDIYKRNVIRLGQTIEPLLTRESTNNLTNTSKTIIKSMTYKAS